MRTRWVPRTLRVRLTAWHVGVMVVVLGIYASVVLLLVTRNASATIDAQIRSDFRWAAEMAQQGPDGSLSWFEGDEWSEDSPWLQVWSPSGHLIYRTRVARRLPVPESEALVAQADGQIASVPAAGRVPHNHRERWPPASRMPMVLWVPAATHAQSASPPT